MITTTLTGRLGRSPERRLTSAGKPWLRFSVAVSQGDEGTEWVNVTVFGELVDELPDDLEAGERLRVEGRLKLSRWEGHDGPRSSLQVNAKAIELLDRAGSERRASRRKPKQQSTSQPPADAASVPQRIQDDPMPW
ncbi:single-stranded DNA-binding protein [Hyphomicrobium sp. CS1BSMeth3]|uniref:single-stranded DNA-binding protein n=1 Tax=Hyphomicrobium sp. CS1BSMeth3 TaxID=1892844 RepID=UPI0009313AA8|nr:single-stranded DNA-binding protein [Hyphomicrobium sp. CS1BSMeth3]